MNWPNVLVLLLLQIAEAPEAPGVYYRQNDTTWVVLKAAPIAEMKTSGMELFIATGGYTNLGMSIVCRGPEASLRIASPKPVFFVRGVGSAEDAFLVRLTQKKDRRTFRTSSSAASVENKGGFKRENIQRTAVTMNPDKSFLVTPEEDLKPGEYMFVFGYATAGFDFGIDPVK
jgi:hypothetical protein